MVLRYSLQLFAIHCSSDCGFVIIDRCKKAEGASYSFLDSTSYENQESRITNDYKTLFASTTFPRSLKRVNEEWQARKVESWNSKITMAARVGSLALVAFDPPLHLPSPQPSDRISCLVSIVHAQVHSRMYAYMYAAHPRPPSLFLPRREEWTRMASARIPFMSSAKPIPPSSLGCCSSSAPMHP